ncbi:coiled-coil domain-containing protein 171-like, partial [Pituophis catenifer annectens]|uniref:coiled-coil domain-containing protein 171-like n=1 Tax=Pituophis catenifer annectens TaxID=94852 RepID=UPI003992DEAD
LSNYESQIAKLRAEVEKSEAVRQSLEYELAVARKEVGIERYSSEEKLGGANKQIEQLQETIRALQQKLNEAEKTFHINKCQWDEKQRRFINELSEKELLISTCHAEYETLLKERMRLDDILKETLECQKEQKNVIESEIIKVAEEEFRCQAEHWKSERNELQFLLQESTSTVQNVHKKIQELEREHNGCSEALRRQASELQFGAERETRLRKELELTMARVKKLEENIEAERASHLESKFNSEIIQVN